MSFTQELRQAADRVFEAILAHPFVQGIAKGELTSQQLIHYVGQDYQFLTAAVRIFGLALSKCPDREEMALFNDRIGFILNSESHPHHNFCRVAGVRYEELQNVPWAPTTSLYIGHLFTVAHQGSVGELIAAFLPCPWTYFEIGKVLMEQVKPEPDHPFYEWITFYGAAGRQERLPGYLQQLERWAQRADQAERERMRRHFLAGCQMEYLFWDMAYKLEGWPIHGVLEE